MGAYVKQAGPMVVIIDELQRAATLYREAVAYTDMLAVQATGAGTLVTGLSVFTGQAAQAATQTGALVSGLVVLKAEAEVVAYGIEQSTARYQEIESRISDRIGELRVPAAAGRSLMAVVQGETLNAEDVGILVQHGLPFAASSIQLLSGGALPLRNFWNLSRAGASLLAKKELNDADFLWFLVGGFASANNIGQLGRYEVKEVTKDHRLGKSVEDGEWIQLGWGTGDLKHMVDTAALSFPENAGESAIMVTKYHRPDGTISARVTIQGTQFNTEGNMMENLAFETNAFGPSGQVEAMNLDSQHVIDAIEYALEDAGIPAGSDLTFDGWSQGGAHAANAAASPKVNSKFNVRGVVGYAGVESGIELPRDVIGLNMYNEQDNAVGLSGRVGPVQAGRRDLVFEEDSVPMGEDSYFGDGHKWEYLHPTIIEYSQNEQLMAQIQPQLDMIADTTTGRAEMKIYELTRQHPKPLRNPLHQYADSVTGHTYSQGSVAREITENEVFGR